MSFLLYFEKTLGLKDYDLLFYSSKLYSKDDIVQWSDLLSFLAFSYIILLLWILIISCCCFEILGFEKCFKSTGLKQITSRGR